MTRFRSFPALLVFMMLGASLIACGGSSESPPPPASSDAASTAPPAGEETTSRAAAPGTADPAAADERLGAALPEPGRYYGVYASADRPDRQWFIAEATRPAYAEQAPEVPPGHLALGAMFGDVAPWHLKTLSPTRFEQAWVPDGQPEPVAIEFELDAEGKASAFRFTSRAQTELGLLERQGDLPDGW
jgi:hypothetical protein